MKRIPVNFRIEPNFVMNSVNVIVQAKCTEYKQYAMLPILDAISIAERLNGVLLPNSADVNCEPGFKLVIYCKILFKSAEDIYTFVNNINKLFEPGL